MWTRHSKTHRHNGCLASPLLRQQLQFGKLLLDTLRLCPVLVNLQESITSCWQIILLCICSSSSSSCTVGTPARVPSADKRRCSRIAPCSRPRQWARQLRGRG